MNTFIIIAAFIFGTCWGSFLNVVIWRLPREQSLGGRSGRSECPHCGHALAWFDLVPLVSFAIGQGVCRYCHKKISVRYPLIEVITGFLFAAAAAATVPHDLISWLLMLKLLTIISVCITVFVIDLEHYLILNKIVYPAIIITGFLALAISLASGTYQPILSSLICAIAAYLIFGLVWLVSKGKWMGFGDVKLVAWIGLALAWPATATAVFLSFIIGAIVGLALIALGKKQLSSRIPFGTFLSATTLLAAFYGPELWTIYWGIFQP